MPRKGENIYKRKDGRWEGRYIRDRVNGKVKYGYVFAHSYKEVKIKLTDAKARLALNTSAVPVIASELLIWSFSRASDEWIQANKSQWKESSTVKYINILNNHLLTEFGQRNITDIARADIQAYISKLLTSSGRNNAGLAPKTVNSIISVMKNIFEFTAETKQCTLISFNGLNVKQPQKQMRILSQAEQSLLTEYLLEESSNTDIGILLSLYTGLRVGEVCALKWEDISFRDNCIHVHKTMQRIQVKGNSDHKSEIIISAPKSECSVRDVPIPDKLLLMLQKRQNAPYTYFLTGKTNLYVEPRTMQNRFKSTIKKAGIALANFHALRHTFATRCIELGFDIKSLSEILGHASVNITLNRYVHPSMELKQKNMNKLSDLLAVK